MPFHVHQIIIKGYINGFIFLLISIISFILAWCCFKRYQKGENGVLLDEAYELSLMGMIVLPLSCGMSLIFFDKYVIVCVSSTKSVRIIKNSINVLKEQ